jgi:hypothetical protein
MSSRQPPKANEDTNEWKHESTILSTVLLVPKEKAVDEEGKIPSQESTSH